MARFLRSLKDVAEAILRKIKALPDWSPYAVLILVLAGITFVYVWRWGLRQQIDAGLVAKKGQPQFLENLWFLPDGRLVGTQRVGQRIIVSIWNSQNGSLVGNAKVFNLSASQALLHRALVDDPKVSINREELTNREELPTFYAITRDGSRMAMVYEGYLSIFGGDDNRFSAGDDNERLSGIVDLGYTRRDLPSALSITDNGLIALAYPNGKVELRDPVNIEQVVGSVQTKLNNPQIMKPLGYFLAVISPINAAVVMLDLRTLTRDTALHAYPPSSLEYFTLAISNRGSLAIATGSPRVFMSQADGSGDASIPLEASGTVKILSFYDDDRVLAGGDFSDVYLLSKSNLPEMIASAPKGINALAVNANRIAYAGNDGVFLIWHTKRRLLSTSGKSAIGIFIVLAFGLLALYRHASKKDDEEIPVEPQIPALPDVLRLPEPPRDLVEICAAGESVLYGGAGLGVRSGLPIWKEFVHSLLEWAVDNRFLNDVEAASFHAEVDTGGADPVADSVISRLTNPDQLALLNTYLRKVFLKSSSPSLIHFLLRRIKFSAVLTTNFDTLLDRYYEPAPPQIFTPKDADSLLSALTKRDNFILKLYGTLDQPDTVMVAPAQYESAIAGNRVFAQFMQTLFVSRTILFVGASVEGIDAYLKGISLPKEVARRHYALVAVTGNVWRAKAEVLERRYGIKILPYTPDEKHTELTDFLQKLVARVSAEAVTSDGKPVTSRLKRLTLENIGPFENLELEFDTDLQVLLGDNGVGKSTILKAMALALCGEDARDYAGRLLRFKSNRGKIILETDNKTSYVTEIDQDEKSGETTITSNTARPLEAEGWLAIGFPPLRTTSWTPPKGPEADYKPKARPVAEDLIPLISGDVDPRLDKLKQWIVTLDYSSIKSGSASPGKPDRYRRLIERVFASIVTVTEGMTLKFGGVEAGTNRVIVMTDGDAEIPLEALSQGTISLIGWVGIVMQRLYEIYGLDEDPAKRYALILMDEIDAHMHPSWQRTLINHLREVFPRAQFIVTTHSPLVVGGLPVRQVMRFARDKEGKVVMPLIEPDMTFGYTDQILTSMLFGLPTSLDDTTEKKKKRYYELFEMADRQEFQEEYERLKQELMLRIPPHSTTYEEKHGEQLSEARMLKTLADRLKKLSPEGGQVLFTRAERLRSGIKGGASDDSD
jgi:predicted ATP-binding protein involved in virulence